MRDENLGMDLPNDRKKTTESVDAQCVEEKLGERIEMLQLGHENWREKISGKIRNGNRSARARRSRERNVGKGGNGRG
ncbi:hypothetical protein L484_024732 [Morus notabilis]|uniref:Uncharacterized protein n=1 Tax=Morus notabilis TaxID=981085 RepID=W9R4P2_9ROSA|nr:hypothetical protein L484_024732 [Morus notabilis]